MEEINLEAKVEQYKLKSQTLEKRVNFLKGELKKSNDSHAKNLRTYMKVLSKYDNCMTLEIDKMVEGMGNEINHQTLDEEKIGKGDSIYDIVECEMNDKGVK